MNDTIYLEAPASREEAVSLGFTEKPWLKWVVDQFSLLNKEATPFLDLLFLRGDSKVYGGTQLLRTPTKRTQ